MKNGCKQGQEHLDEDAARDDGVDGVIAADVNKLEREVARVVCHALKQCGVRHQRVCESKRGEGELSTKDVCER